MKCIDCNGSGRVRTYINGRVLSAYCYCPKGSAREEERDQLCLSVGSLETDRKYRLRYAKGTPKRY